jgi:hypothetical protein
MVKIKEATMLLFKSHSNEMFPLNIQIMPITKAPGIRHTTIMKANPSKAETANGNISSFRALEREPMKQMVIKAIQ